MEPPTLEARHVARSFRRRCVLSDLAGALARRATREDGRPDRRFLLAVFVAVYAVFVVTYLAVNLYSVGRPAWSPILPGEARIPFVPAFELVYASGYLLPAVAVLWLPDGERFVRLLLAFGLTLLVAYATYLLFPVYLERPPLVVDSLPTWMLSLEYRDPSYNHLPSLHVAISWLVWLSCRTGVRHPRLLLAWVVAVSLSTLFVKQHFVVDVATGAALAVVAWWVAGRISHRNVALGA
jgi:membrane-associated phospholipid phosphatase